VPVTKSYTAISIKVVHEQSGKDEYERERLLGIANKLMNFQSGSQQPFALVFVFSALLQNVCMFIIVYQDLMVCKLNRSVCYMHVLSEFMLICARSRD
jgi:hypothetical protein